MVMADSRFSWFSDEALDPFRISITTELREPVESTFPSSSEPRSFLCP